MKPEELEEVLNGASETQRIEFKGACSWNAVGLAKDILALSNVQDGGYIIIGVRDGSFEREGVSEAQRLSFDVDIMRDQMASYSDPHVNFTVGFTTDSEERVFVIIRVFEFEDIPVICRRDSSDTTIATMYYRNRNRRIESARVSNSNDMRDILTRAAIKLMRRLEGHGLSVELSDTKRLEEELGGL